jgi:hypothetical protein
MDRGRFIPSVVNEERTAKRALRPKVRNGTMGRYERQIFLERLVELRVNYNNTAHEATSTTVDAAIDYATGLFDDTNRLEAILAEEPADTTSTSDSPA